MADITTHNESPAPAWVVPTVQATSALLTIGIVIQAFLGTSGMLQQRPNLVTAHEMIGNIAFLLAVAQVVAAFIGMQKGLLSRGLVITSAVVVVLVIAQLGLGYSGRENFDIRTWHIANGVALMGACTWSAATAFMGGRK